MGLFDTIQYNGKEYQSHTFDCNCSRYHIENGRLFIDSGGFVGVPDEEKQSKWHIIKWQSGALVDKNFHGIVEATENAPPHKSVFLKFTDGKLVSIESAEDALLMAMPRRAAT